MAFNQPEDYRESHKNKGLNYQEGFERIPHRAMMWELEQSVLDKMFGEFFPEQRPDYLDFACGTGRILGYLADRARSSTGVDVSQSMLSVARARVPGANIIQCDITRDDPFDGQTFDLITAFRFFPNAQPSLRREAMNVLMRHLAPRGILVFNNHVNDSSLVKRITRALGLKRPSMPTNEVRRLIDEAGLQIATKYPLSFLPLTEKWMLRPVWLTKGLETAAANLFRDSETALNIIYVCRRSG